MRRLVVISHVAVAAVAGRWVGKNRVVEVVDELARRGWKVSLVAPRSARHPYLTHPVSDPVEVVPTGRRLAAAVAIARADACLVFGPSLRSYVCAVLLGRRATLYLGNAWELQGGYPSWRVRLERLSVRRAGAVVAAGDAVAAHCRRWSDWVEACVPLVPAEIVERLRRGVEGEANAPVRVLYVGSIAAAKGVPAVIAAAELRPDVPFRLIGADGGAEAGELRARAARLRNVEITDYAGWDVLRSAYEWATVLVLPSRSEGFPRVAYEAAAHGATLVVSPVGGVPHRLVDRRDALFVGPGDAEAVIEALDELAARPQFRVELAKQAARSLAAVFVEPSSADQFDRLLQRRFGAAASVA